jgi:CBS domain-containing protein
MFTDSSILNRIKRFLTDIHPFTFFSEEDLMSLVRTIDIAVVNRGESVFEKGKLPQPHFYIVKKGAVEIINREEGQAILIDKCGEGDMFGIRPILAQSPYAYESKCSEDSILYEVPIDLFKQLYYEYPEAVDYMIHRFAAGRSIREDYEDETSILSPMLPSMVLKYEVQKDLVKIHESSSFDQAIQKMNVEGVSSIVIVNEHAWPKGIITDRDIRSFVAQHYNFEDSVTKFMSHPVRCIPPNMDLQEIQLIMIESGLHHLCITEDGSDQSKGLGMVTEHDILYANASDPVVILKKIKSARDLKALKTARIKIDRLLPNFIYQDNQQKNNLRLIEKLNKALIRKVVQLALQTFNESGTQITDEDFSFYTMGSTARGEQLLMTDQDNGILISDDSTVDRSDFLALGKLITDYLHEIGYEYCPANMMASNQDWCKTLEEMVAVCSSWILSPGPEEVLKSAIFFDAVHSYGNEDLFNQLHLSIKDLLEQQDVFLRFMAKQVSLNPPPSSFFRKFIIEKDGAHKDLFDIKLRAIAPLSDSARLLALEEGFLQSTSTIERLEIMIERDEANAILYADAIKAYLKFLSIRLSFALKNGEGGRYINPEALDKVDRIYLRRAFKPIGSLIDMIERKYQTNYL